MNTAAQPLTHITRPQVLPPVPPLSQSMYESMACPASYQAMNVHGVDSPSGPLAELSNQMHRVMRLYVLHLRDAELREDWPFFESLLSECSREAQSLMRGFIESMEFDPRTILEVEKRFIYDDAAGTPDLVTMETPLDATIWDYKNYYDIIPADTFQAKLYPLLLFRHNPSLESVRFVLVFMRYGATRDVVWVRDQVPFLEKVVADARVQQRAIHELTGLAEAIPGRACTYCPLLQTARCQVNDWNPRAVMTPQQRLSYQIYLDTASRANRELLREHARFEEVTTTDANGKTYRARFTATIRKFLRADIGLPVIGKWREKSGEDLFPKMTLSQTPLRSLRNAKKRKELDRMLAEVEAERLVPHFKMDRVNEEHPDFEEAESEEEEA